MRTIRFAEKINFLFIILNLIIHDFLHDFNASKMSARLSRISSEIQQIVNATKRRGGAGEKPAVSKKSEKLPPPPPQRPLPPPPPASVAASMTELDVFSRDEDPEVDSTSLKEYEDFGITESGTEINVLRRYVVENLPKSKPDNLILDDTKYFDSLYKMEQDEFFTGAMTRSRVKATQMAKQIIDEIKLFVIGYTTHSKGLTKGGRVLNRTRNVKEFDFEDINKQIYKPTSDSNRHSKKIQKNVRFMSKRKQRRPKQTRVRPIRKSTKTTERSKMNSKNEYAIQFIINGIDTAIRVFGNYEVNVNGEIHFESDVKMQNLLEIMKRLFLMYLDESNGLTPFDVFNLPQIEDLLILYILSDNLSNSEIDEPSLLFLTQMYYKLHTEDSAELNRLRYEFHGIPLEPSAKMSGGAPLSYYKSFIEDQLGPILYYYYTPEESNVHAVISSRPTVESIISMIEASEIKDCFKPKKIETAKTAIAKASSKYVAQDAPGATKKRATTEKKKYNCKYRICQIYC